MYGPRVGREVNSNKKQTMNSTSPSKQNSLSKKIFLVILSSVGLIMIFNSFGCQSEESSIPASFQIEKGFSMKLVASEPLIKDPVDLEFNEKGEAFVLEMPGYPFEDQQSRIILLKDKNNDGVYDENVIYAEGLQLASSILPYKKGVLVAAPPFLLHVIDTNGDEIADKTDTLMSGFSTGNLQHNYNGLTYGIDNWIYAANGGNSGQPFWWGDSSSVIDLRGEDFRFNLDKHLMERIGESSGGFGLAINEWGHIFETHNLEHISQSVFHQNYIGSTPLSIRHTLSNISDHEENGLSRIYPIGAQESRVNHPEQSGYFSGSCGISHYGGGSFGSEYDHTIWLADVVLNLIHIDKISNHGSASTASRVMEKREFLASTDRSFRPVNMTVGPNGDMYIVDMYREVIEHPEWIPDDIEATLDLHAGKNQGRIYQISKTESASDKVDMSKFKSIDGLIKSLGDSNQWMRSSAHRLLMEDKLNQTESKLLAKALDDENSFMRLHALWILSEQNLLTQTQLIAKMQDAVSGIRENALKISEYTINREPGIIETAMTLLMDESQRVRMQAALTLSTLDYKVLLPIKKQLSEAIVKSSQMDMDQWNVAALSLAAKSISADLFQHLIKQKNPDEKLLISLSRSAAQNQSTLTTVLKSLSEFDGSAEIKSSIISALTKSLDPAINPKGLITFLNALEAQGDVNLISSIAGMHKKFNLPPSKIYLDSSKAAFSKITDPSMPTDVRMAQLALIDLVPFSQKSELLYSCLSNKEPISLQEAALKQLWEADDPGIGSRLVKLWPQLGPISRKYAGDILLYKQAHHDALLTGLEKGSINIGEMNFDLERRRTLLWWTDDDITKRRAEALFSDSGVVNRKEAIDSMRQALTLNGIPTKGLEVFTSLCAQCHIYGSIGKNVGPVLTEINRKSKEQLMNDILDPNAAADTKYINHKIEMRDGTLHIGIVDLETDDKITIKKMGGLTVTIDKEAMKSFESLGTSMMPEGLEGSMTHQDMADLLAFLQNSATSTL
jgi:putative membrane-bound dehydrogenase-like protein